MMTTTSTPSWARFRLLLPLLVVLPACGDSSPSQPNDDDPPTTYTYQLSLTGGGSQVARVESTPESPVTLRLVRSDGIPVSGASLNVEVTAGGGSVTSSVATDAQGIASIQDWVLGSEPGTNTLRVASPTHSPELTVSATARWPHWTVMVYLAADNNLSSQGFIDLEEMEAAGFDPEVQVVVQGEYNPIYMLLDGLTLGVLNLENWGTFRYVIGDDQRRLGIDGDVTYLGSTDMTAPETLTDFVTWAQEQYPAERFALVPWNHGGGYAGLIQDLTNRGSHLMSMDGFRSALMGTETLDLVDFDMCLMAGYETLLSLDGLANVAVFSEELVPGKGNPYHLILDRLQADPSASTEDVARMFVDEYTAFYAGGRSSTTKSAYAVNSAGALDASLSNLATALESRIGVLRPTLVDVLSGSQKFAYAELTDIVDFASRLQEASDDPVVDAAASEVIAAGTDPSFRLAFENYSASEEYDVSRATGLHVVFPSGAEGDAFHSSGSRSLSGYATSYPTSTWGDFLAAWTEAQSTTPTVDLGTGRALELYEVWDEATVEAGADVDFWLLEPDGQLFVPWFGTVTPNGLFSGDSYESDPPSYYEGWFSRQVIQQGTYKIYAHLWTGPSEQQTNLNVAYRFSAGEAFTELYNEDPVRLSFTSSIEDDATPSLEEADAGMYTNFQWVAVWDVQPGVAPQLLVRSEDFSTAWQVVGADQVSSAEIRAILDRAGRAPGQVLRQGEVASGLATLQPADAQRRRDGGER